MKAQQLWQHFEQETGIQATYKAWSFCGGGKDGDCLGNLVPQGIKTATASLAKEYIDEPMPKVGEYSVILDSHENAMCIIQTT